MIISTGYKIKIALLSKISKKLEDAWLVCPFLWFRLP